MLLAQTLIPITVTASLEYSASQVRLGQATGGFPPGHLNTSVREETVAKRRRERMETQNSTISSAHTEIQISSVWLFQFVNQFSIFISRFWLDCWYLMVYWNLKLSLFTVYWIYSSWEWWTFIRDLCLFIFKVMREDNDTKVLFTLKTE